MFIAYIIRYTSYMEKIEPEREIVYGMVARYFRSSLEKPLKVCSVEG